ncbi:MAG TPA: alpha-L-fucosidase [Planctomicrobium sp.]|nr:alpha-L-fucosidase [Planctomicrobium sp.]
MTLRIRRETGLLLTWLSVITLTMPLQPILAEGRPEQLHCAKPTPQQVDWLSRNSMFICLDPCTWQGKEYDDHSLSASAINPKKLDTNQWCEVARSWGASQLLFVAKHTGGFCWWQTDTSKYGVKESSYKGGNGDVLAELAESARAHGLKMAIYVSPIDDQWRAGPGGRTANPDDQLKYNEVYRQQMIEVLSKYGPMVEVWFDGSLIIPVQDIVEQYAPTAMQFQGPHATIRWSGNENGIAPYPTWQTVRKADAESGIATAAHSDPNGDVWLPFEINTTLLDHKWFWAPDTDSMMKSLPRLMETYYTSVGRGCPLLLNSTPDTTGLIPDSHVARYKEFAAEVQRRFGHAVAESKGGTGIEFKLTFPKTSRINHVILAEDVREGQRIREYVVEGLQGNQWITLVPNGSSVGYKRIDRFPTQEVTALRLRVTKSADEPIVTRLAAYAVEGIEEELNATQESDNAIERDWVEVIAWTPELIEQNHGIFDISKHIKKPGEFRMTITDAEGNLVEMENVELFIQDRLAKDRVRKNSHEDSEYLLYRMEQVTKETPTKLKIVPRDKTVKGTVRLRLAK